MPWPACDNVPSNSNADDLLPEFLQEEKIEGLQG